MTPEERTRNECPHTQPRSRRTRRKRSFWERLADALATGGMSLIVRRKGDSGRA